MFLTTNTKSVETDMTSSKHFDKLKFVYTINTYASGLPGYNFKNGKHAEHNFRIYYVAINAAIIFSGFCYSIYGRSVFGNMEFGVLICDDLANITLTICVLFNMIYLYNIGAKNAAKLLNLLKSYSTDHAEGYFIFTTTILGLCGIILFDVIVICLKFPIAVIQYYIFKYLKYTIVVFQILLMNIILKRISGAVEGVRRDLNESINSFTVLPIGEMHESGKGMFTLTGWTKSVLETKAGMADVGKIERCTKEYKDIYLMTHYFSKIFGWPIMFILAMVLFEVIMMMDWTVNFCMKEDGEGDAYFLSLKIVTAFYFYVLEVSIVLNCEDVIEKTGVFANDTYKQILALCECQDTISEQMILKELMALWYYVINNKPKFPAGFVVLRKKFIYGSFIAVSSFIAVVVEFNRFINNHNHLDKIKED